MDTHETSHADERALAIDTLAAALKNSTTKKKGRLLVLGILCRAMRRLRSDVSVAPAVPALLDLLDSTGCEAERCLAAEALASVCVTQTADCASVRALLAPHNDGWEVFRIFCGAWNKLPHDTPTRVHDRWSDEQRRLRRAVLLVLGSLSAFSDGLRTNVAARNREASSPMVFKKPLFRRLVEEWNKLPHRPVITSHLGTDGEVWRQSHTETARCVDQILRSLTVHEDRRVGRMVARYNWRCPESVYEGPYSLPLHLEGDWEGRWVELSDDDESDDYSDDDSEKGWWEEGEEEWE